jgi:putative SOS response-associated peptidase YedK
LRVSPAELAEIFGVLRAIDSPPRYNIAPTQSVAAVRLAGQGGGRELGLFRWGLIPAWAKDARIGSSLINARAETLATKPAFRSALNRKRCLIPADGFYEWQAVPGEKVKQPFFIGVRDVPVFAFAGLWEQWTAPEGNVLQTCTIVTTEANELMRRVHTRMPVILDPADYDRWLDCPRHDAQSAIGLLKPFPSERMQLVPVSTLVNSPRNELAACVEPQ